MKSLTPYLKASGRIDVAGAPPGIDAIVLGDLVASGRTVLHIARDDARMAMLSDALSFFHPDVAVLTFPAWDCLPYDRVSPNGEVVARRIATLAELAAEGEPRRRVVLTTVNAVLQRVPKRALFAASAFGAAVGERVSSDALVDFLTRNGYTRADTVREPGEFAVRGGIIDLFPPGTPEPLRLDLFGDVVDEIRTFDPMTQRSRGRIERFTLRPVSEVFVDEESVKRFRSGYRELFGAVGDEDPLYAAISAGHRHPGYEHWLPLFHDRLETLFDYVPDAVITLDHQADEAVAARLEQIGEFYEARRSLLKGKQAEGPPYRPLPPDRLYLTAADWVDRLGVRMVAAFSPFARPDDAGASVVDLGGRPGPEFAAVRSQPRASLFDSLKTHFAAEQSGGRRIIVAAYSAGSRDRLGGLLRDHGIEPVVNLDAWAAAGNLAPDAVGLVILGLERGFTADGVAVVTEQDILGDRLVRAAKRRVRPDNFLTEVSTLGVGDLVVHVDHGIGRFDGLVTLEVNGAPHDMLRILYEGNDKLFVPVENIDVLSRYGSEEAGVQLDKLGGVQWQARKARVKQRITEMADKLIQIAAARKLSRLDPLAPPQGLYEEFCARFPYPETEDQARAIDDSLGDLTTGRVMDRLVCGDVGFGKTEVALRAAFVAAMSGMQVAVVVPTTLLARQHFRTFRARFEGFPVRIEQLSRLVPAKQAADIRRDLADGKIDIIVGTTALLAKNIAFKNLGLLIVDEEQHFGVAQKERLKQLKANIHVLTLTATPIPRTLQMALMGVRDMSIIATPPVDRLAVRTFVLPFDPVVVREAIMRERFRGGQTYYVCPRIEDLGKVRERLAELVPECKIAVAHGRLTGTEIETIMTGFVEGAYDILLSTNIIESGLDIPRVNTIIIHRADMFGLAQLYQLRGRVGRAKTRAYAYLTVPPNRLLTPAAQKRLEVMQTLDSLGAGFQLASYDLDIRGAGNLLGEEQSGHIREVGIELYQHMLEEAVRAAREEGAIPAPAAADWAPQINLGMPVLIPETYVEDLDVRLGLYRRLATIVDQAEIDAFAAELIDRFGPLPPEVENLLQVIAIKRLCKQASVDRIEVGPKGAVLSFRDNRFAHPDKLIQFVMKRADTVKLRPDHKLVFMRAWDEPKQRLKGVGNLLTD
ncbi:MAG TPA: transcription-repair coupling factor, partial [Alphaproteobacteria bacterium]